jgi:hypothetical protein
MDKENGASDIISNLMKGMNEEESAESMKLDGIENETNELTSESASTSNKNKPKNIANILALLRLYSTMRMMKEDNKPVEILEGLFIGSIAAASNKEALKENNITNVVVCGVGLKKYYPEVRGKIIKLIILNRS